MTKLVRLSKGHAALKSATCQPNAKALTVMVSARFLGRTVLLRYWQTTDLTAPVHYRRIQHAPLL